jgi:hypothetical protein
MNTEEDPAGGVIREMPGAEWRYAVVSLWFNHVFCQKIFFLGHVAKNCCLSGAGGRRVEG